jgi:hypothetical protein
MGAIGRILGGIALIAIGIIGFAWGGGMLTALGTALFGGAISVGASLTLGGIAQATRPRPKIPTQSRQLSYRAVAPPRVFVYGRARIGGFICFLHLAGSSSEFLYIVMALCEGGPDGIEEIPAIYFAAEEVTFASHAFDTTLNATGNYAGFVTAELKKGSDTQAASALLIADIPTKWTSSEQGKGVAHLVLKLKHNLDKFRNFNLEQVRIQLKGRKCFDPRTGTTIYTENPAVQARDYLVQQRPGLRWSDEDQRAQFPGDGFFRYVESLANWNEEWGGRNVGGGRGSIGTAQSDTSGGGVVRGEEPVHL